MKPKFKQECGVLERTLEEKFPKLEEKTLQYEKPTITRHAVIMTMAPAGSKMGHGVFPFVSKSRKYNSSQKGVYRR